MQEAEAASCAQQREQESLLAVVCKSLKEEHQAELQKLRRQIKQVGKELREESSSCGVEKLTWSAVWWQERQGAALRLEQATQLAQREAERLRLMLQEKESSYNQVAGEQEQQLRHWAQQLGAECQHLVLLLEQSGAKQAPVHIPPRYY